MGVIMQEFSLHLGAGCPIHWCIGHFPTPPPPKKKKKKKKKKAPISMPINGDILFYLSEFHAFIFRNEETWMSEILVKCYWKYLCKKIFTLMFILFLDTHKKIVNVNKHIMSVCYLIYCIWKVYMHKFILQHMDWVIQTKQWNGVDAYLIS